MYNTQIGNALYVCGRSNEKGKLKEKRKIQIKSHSHSNIECYYSHKRGHMKKDCRQWKNEKGKEKNNGNKKEDKEKSIVKPKRVTSYLPLAWTPYIQQQQMILLQMIGSLIAVHSFTSLHTENGSKTMMQDAEAKSNLKMV